MSSGFNISLVKGEPFHSTVTATLCTSGNFNLSGYGLTGGIRFRYSESNAVDFDITVNSEPSGIFSLDLTVPQVSGLQATEYLYYVKAWPSGGGSTIDLLNGYALVYPL